MDKGNWKRNILILGGILGALTGFGAAYILIQRAEQNNVRPSLTPGEGVKIGLGVLGLLRLISDSGRD
jgi:hypothetical protein